MCKFAPSAIKGVREIKTNPEKLSVHHLFGHLELPAEVGTIIISLWMHGTKTSLEESKSYVFPKTERFCLTPVLFR
jgi:hypothetical protein